MSLILIILFSVAFLSSKGYSIVNTSSKINNISTIIIDAGHGGFDGGAVAFDGTIEKDINLNIALCLADMLKAAGYNVVLTRQTDNSTETIDSQTNSIAKRKKNDLENRLQLMNDYPDGIFVSIHLNKFTTTAAKGSQVFYNSKIESSKLLGEEIQGSIIQMLQPENTRVNKQATTSTYILYNATLPAVLVECGFLSNKDELVLLKNEEYQKKLAFAIFCGDRKSVV